MSSDLESHHLLVRNSMESGDQRAWIGSLTGCVTSKECLVLCVVLMEQVSMRCPEFGQSFTSSHRVPWLFPFLSFFFSAPFSYLGGGGAMGKGNGKKMGKGWGIPLSPTQAGPDKPRKSDYIPVLRCWLPHGFQEQCNASFLFGEHTAWWTLVLAGSFCWMPQCGFPTSNSACLLHCELLEGNEALTQSGHT